ncbi:uncharacterized protein LOC143942297 [Lithobates pipiens]
MTRGRTAAHGARKLTDFYMKPAGVQAQDGADRDESHTPQETPAASAAPASTEDHLSDMEDSGEQQHSPAISPADRGYARTIILLIILSMAMNGPASNMLENVQQVTNSSACGVQVVMNQTIEIVERVKEPLRIK